jgi:serine phosphatase RsbU (regulator of sigma subunit)/pSer/pThr/pTyr-binding forkhead associated (FHA) protein
MASLFAIDGPSLGTRYPLEKPVSMLGRSAQSDVRVTDPRVSRAHARIRVDGDRYILEDLQGRQERGGGTYVNGRPITYHVLRDEDVITLAGAAFRFEDPQVEPTERMRRAELEVLGASPDQTIQDAVEAGVSPLTSIAMAGGAPILAEAQERLKTIYDVSEAISTILDQAQLIDEILGALERVFRQASRVVLLTLDRQTGDLVERAERVRKEARAQRKIPISRKIMAEVIEHKRALIFGGGQAPSTNFTGMMAHSMLCAPLCARGEVSGVIHLTSRDLATPFVRADLDLLVGIATQAAIALQNAELHKELLARERLKYDVEIAQEVQRRFLPLVPPRVEGWSFATEYRPAFAVGGDFYDFISLGPGRLGVLVGDVSGKGVSAALLMARVTSEFRTLAMIEPAPEAVMGRVNASLVAAGYEGIFVTACYLVLDLARGELAYCNAGHLPPLVRRWRTSKVERLEIGDTALGVLDDTQFTPGSAPMEPGDLLLLMSDGVIESTNAEKEQLGFERVEETLRTSRGGAEGALEGVMNLVRDFVRDAPPYDDLTMVCFSRDLTRTGRQTISPDDPFASATTQLG